MTIKRVVLNFLTGAMYLIFPMLFTTYLAFSGMHAARGIDGAATSMMGRLSGASRIRFNRGKKQDQNRNNSNRSPRRSSQ